MTNYDSLYAAEDLSDKLVNLYYSILMGNENNLNALAYADELLKKYQSYYDKVL